MEEQVTSTVIEMLKQMNSNMNSRFDRIEGNHESIRKQVTDLDRDAVRRQEFQDTMKGLLDEFGDMTERLETEVRTLAGMKPVIDTIVPRAELETQWRLQQQVHKELRKEIADVRRLFTSDGHREEQKKREKRQLMFSIIAGVCSSAIVYTVTYLIAHLQL